MFTFFLRLRVVVAIAIRIVVGVASIVRVGVIVRVIVISIAIVIVILMIVVAIVRIASIIALSLLLDSNPEHASDRGHSEKFLRVLRPCKLRQSLHCRLKTLIGMV